MPYEGFDPKTLKEAVTLHLTKKDVFLLITALDVWHQDLSRHEQELHTEIGALLEKLPSRESLKQSS